MEEHLGLDGRGGVPMHVPMHVPMYVRYACISVVGEM